MKYAIKALTFLAKNSTVDTPAKTADVSEKMNIPKKFLEQILLDLKRENIINSRQGNSGGYYLKAKPKEISFAKIYRIFEGPIALLPCASETQYEPCSDCPSEALCQIRKNVLIIRKSTLATMEKISLENLI